MILTLPWREGIEIIKEGRERTQRNEFWLMYCNMYPRMTEDNFQTFEDWYESLKKTLPEPQSVEDILASVNDIINMTTGGNNGFITV